MSIQHTEQPMNDTGMRPHPIFPLPLVIGTLIVPSRTGARHTPRVPSRGILGTVT
jgi:hypothetical protein